MANILLIEDETSLLDVYSEVLESEGHIVFKAADGDQGLKLALNEEWDVLFLDIMLPGMDGISLLKKLKESGKLENRHVIVLSNLANPDVVSESLRQGAVEHLNKSDISPQNIVSTVQKYLSSPQDEKKS